jgi:hypothetical protein
MSKDIITNKINDAIESERLDLSTSINILINAVQANYDRFSDLDKFLISKSLSTFKSYADSKEDIVIKFSK